jgi:hypothetical protein
MSFVMSVSFNGAKFEFCGVAIVRSAQITTRNGGAESYEISRI